MAVRDFNEWLRVFRGEIPVLGHAKSLAFAASCCERALPNYQAFSDEQRWGDPKVLREVLNFVWGLLITHKTTHFSSQNDHLLKALSGVTPDTEDFKSTLTSAALDAAASVAGTLDYVREGVADHVIDIAALSRDTIDIFLHQTRRGISETEIMHHPLMIAELNKQQADVEELKVVVVLTPDFLGQFRQKAAPAGKSNLGITPSPEHLAID